MFSLQRILQKANTNFILYNRTCNRLLPTFVSHYCAATTNVIQPPSPSPLQATVWVTNLFPVKVAKWDIRMYIPDYANLQAIENIIEPVANRYNVKIVSATHCFRDGGALVTMEEMSTQKNNNNESNNSNTESTNKSDVISIDDSNDNKTTSSSKRSFPIHGAGSIHTRFKKLEKIEVKQLSESQLQNLSLYDKVNRIGQEVVERDLRLPQCFAPVKLYRVKGTPFIEDFLEVIAASSLTVDINGDEYGNDTLLYKKLFNLFRQFGKIKSIHLSSTKATSTTPRSCEINYLKKSDAIAARYCLDQITFLDEDNNTISNSNNAKPVISKISYGESIPITTKIVKWLGAHTRLAIFIASLFAAVATYFIFDPLRIIFCAANFSSITKYLFLENLNNYQAKSNNGLLTKLFGIEELEKKVKSWLKAPPSTILKITGAPGTGKSYFARSAAELQGGHVLVLDARNLFSGAPEDFIHRLCKTVGFTPGFGFLNNIGSMLELVAPGALAATAATPVAQVDKILDILSRAMATVSDPKPLIIIDGFADFEKGKQNNFLVTLLKWAEKVVASEKGRVIFVTNSNHEIQQGSLRQVLPRAKIDEIHLQDVPISHATEIVKQEFETSIEPEMLQSTIDCLPLIGGRLQDLQTFFRIIKTGLSPEHAAEQMISDTVKQIRTELFNKDSDSANSQLWQMINQIIDQQELDYDYCLFKMFGGDSIKLTAMLASPAFSVAPSALNESDDNIKIVAASPLIYSALKQLHHDRAFKVGMDLIVYKSKISSSEAKVRAYEDELTTLSNIMQSNLQNPYEYTNKDLLKEIKIREACIADLLAKEQASLISLLQKKEQAEIDLSNMKNG